jgi:hypothetical protein
LAAAEFESYFGLGLYDGSQIPNLTNQGATTGFAGEVDINLNGTTSATAFPNGTNQSVVSFASVTTPETSTFLVLGLGLCGLAWLRRR